MGYCVLENNKKPSEFYTYEIQFGQYKYPYYLFDMLADNFIQKICSLQDVDTFVLICDKEIEDIYGNRICKQINYYAKCQIIAIPCHEYTKNLNTLGIIMESVLSYRISRKTCLIALGGGICGNIVGLAAGLLFRGIRFIHIPTTLMAILDSVLSLKQAINSVYGKNLVGMFKKPEMVITSVEFLYTLKKKEIISGMCEVIKNSLAISPKDINILMQKIKCDLNFDIPDYLYFIDSSIKAKTKVMNQDPYEKNMALVLEYGHTIGHAIELASKQQLTHGESIGIGMVYAAKISVDMGYLTQHDLNIHKVMLQKLGARTCVPKSVDKDTILGFIRHDNKRGYLKPNDEYVQMVLLKSLGTPVVHSDSIITMVKEDLIKCAIMYN